MSFLDTFKQLSWEDCKSSIASKTAADVERALARPKGSLTLNDFQSLISPAATAYLEQMAALSHALTVERFGYTQQLYAPLYLSNVCSNVCTYCGFSATNKIPRKVLSEPEIIRELEAVKALGMDHILFVTGEANLRVGVPYLKRAFELAREQFSSISMEVQPMDRAGYETLISAGLSSVLVYQETYNRDTYATHHLKGMKSNFDYRLETPDRLGLAGIKKIGLGALYGLDDWRADTLFVAAHLRYLEQTYWKTKYSLSFPRIRPHEGDFQPMSVMSDRDLVQVICAYRMLSPEVELSLSTRETEVFRDHAYKLGITSMSAGSKTNPGGYVVDPQTLEQFEISDERSPAAVARMLRRGGYEVVWKDWDSTYDSFRPSRCESLTSKT
ncbi:2-iminoacetate synthase ThiH [Pelagicoccus sp. SDUM812002]|uniref:2-iminoacetate synthase ThiH n=1 Tax=Pelagicoccus sp. SDUM812002 TaxID=3041266 RepID=UPI00280DF3F5|nr:2-iminoacetate synthase ThiH [Pelagicoccus sp. SDUM812002]MDQ8184770.1 2-iminoacetate synthase ThiH [Pelagicoccus sp. SDUM812002]